jgi:hypothetical protein
MPKLALVGLVASFLGCTSEQQRDLFGDEGAPSATAQELLAKNDPLTDDSIAGVYERTGTGSGIYHGTDGKTYTVSVKWINRIELRTTALTTVVKCDLTYSEPGRAPKSLIPFTQQSAEATDSFYRVATAGQKTEKDPASMSDCSIDQPATSWAYCEETIGGSEIFTELPEGANLCIGRWDQELRLVDQPYTKGETMGKKVAN